MITNGVGLHIQIPVQLSSHLVSGENRVRSSISSEVAVSVPVSEGRDLALAEGVAWVPGSANPRLKITISL